MATWVMYVITHGANGNVGYNNRLVIAQFTQLKLTSKTRYYYWMLDKENLIISGRNRPFHEL
jgi:hypothetical protein